MFMKTIPINVKYRYVAAFEKYIVVVYKTGKVKIWI